MDGRSLLGMVDFEGMMPSAHSYQRFMDGVSSLLFCILRGVGTGGKLVYCNASICFRSVALGTFAGGRIMGKTCALRDCLSI